MATFDFNRSTLQLFTDRASRVRADTPRLWGTLDSSGAFRHLIFTFEMSLGEHRLVDKSIPLVRDLLYLVFFNWFTRWPQGKLKGPRYTCPPAKGDFESEQRELLATMQRFVEALEHDPTRRTINPGLGKIPLRKWSRVHGVHCDHHLRQFGV